MHLQYINIDNHPIQFVCHCFHKVLNNLYHALNYQVKALYILQKMKEAAGNAADLLLLPEAYLTGYELPISNEEALSDDNPYLKQLCDTARNYSLV